MTYRYLTQLADALRAGGLKVVEIDGWKTRGRPASTGSFDPVGVLWHHTGGADDGAGYAAWLARTGRSDLPAPLCQLSISRDGTVYVCAAGRANHAGVAKASGSVAGGDGNALYVGVECQNTGTEGWPTAQRAAMVATGVVLSGLVGCTPAAQRGHKETSVTGKWDPGALDMDTFRADIAAAIAPPRPPVTPPPPTALGQIRSKLGQLIGKATPGSRRKKRLRRARNDLPGGKA